MNFARTLQRLSTPLFVSCLDVRRRSIQLKLNQENQCYNSSDIRAYTDRSQVFLQLTRQITQAVSDHPHVDNVLKYLRKEQVWIRENWPSPSGDKDAWLWIQNHEFAEDMLDYLWEEAQLARSYSKLYEKRTEIGIHEVFFFCVGHVLVRGRLNRTAGIQ